jgi:glycosyltransferase involved in cell wall biosynthesis
MAAGCPVVACRAGGVPDAVSHGNTGFLFDPDDPSSFVETVRGACKSDGRLAAVRASALHDVEQHSWAASTAKLRLLYSRAAQEGFRRAVKGRIPIPRRIAAGIALGTLRTLLP